MQKKIFLQKGNPRGKSKPLIRWLLWAALALVVLVAVTPLINRQKNHKEPVKKPVAEKGIVMKEVPKTPAPSAANPQTPEGAGSKAVRGAVPGIESTPVVKEPPAAPAEEGAGVSARDKSMETGGDNPPKGQAWVEVKPAEPPGKAPGVPSVPDAGAKPPARAEGAAAPAMKMGAVPAKPAAGAPAGDSGKQKTASLRPSAEKPTEKTSRKEEETGAAKTAPASGKVAYAVQVGSFKEKKNAEAMQENLKKRGYSAILRTDVHPKLGQIYVIQLQAVDDLGKASTLVEQIKHEEKVKPVIIKAPKE